MEVQGRQHEEQAIMRDPTSAQMPSAIDAAPARSQTPARPAADPRERESGGTSVARHPLALPDVRDPDRIKNTAKSTRPSRTTIPSVAVMTPPSRTPPTGDLVEAQAFHGRTQAIHGRRGPTEADPLLPGGHDRGSHEPAGPTTGQSIRPWRERLRRRRGRRPDSSAARPGPRCARGPRSRRCGSRRRRPCVSPTG
jgi:hypothetical protein